MTQQPKEWWRLQKFGKLRLKNPEDLNPGYRKKKEFVCECGKTVSTIVRDVVDKKTSSCGRCNEMPPEWWGSQKFGKLFLKTPKHLHNGSHNKEWFICDCGKEKSIVIRDVVVGKVTSCNKCNEMLPEWWHKRRFGNLELKTPKLMHVGARKKELFKCTCGSEKLYDVSSVTSGRSGSCGACLKNILFWFAKNKNTIRSLKAPVEIISFPVGGLVPLEVIGKLSKSFRATCPLCRKEYKPTLSRIKGGHSLTCGCSANQVSKPAIEIYEFLNSKEFASKLEFKLCGFKYDICIPCSNVIVEFNRTLFHNNKAQKDRDLKKKALAEAYGYSFITVEESRWRRNKSEVKNEILEVLVVKKNRGAGHRTKKEIVAAIDEIDMVSCMEGIPDSITQKLDDRRSELLKEKKHSFEDIMSAAISSHHVMCEVKNMKPDEAFGNNPYTYYSLGLAGEAGELTGAILRAIRNGGAEKDMKAAAESELADCIIYAVILAYATGIDLVRLVNEKARIVETRARSGYYGKPFGSKDDV